MENTQTASANVSTPNDATGALLRLFGAASLKPAAIGDLLDSMEHAERVRAVRSLGRREQMALWQTVDGFAPLTLADIVPAQRNANEEVRHFGKNSLPMFSHFEKRFLRPEAQGTEGEELHGYNFQDSGIATWFSGPGYFIAREDKARGEVLIDYTRIPTVHPAQWPAVRGNERGGARLVYGFMVDTLRRVSAHVTIGRANKHGKDMDAWFLLCRDGSTAG